MHKILLTVVLYFFFFHTNAQLPQPLKRFLEEPALRGASVSFMAKEVKSGNVLYAYDSERELIPASVMKTVTTAVALDLLGAGFRFETSICYDGTIDNGVLNGNIYIRGSGDPTINTSDMKIKKDSIIGLWATAIKNAGIGKINGKIIADEQIFDTEGLSMKWLHEDLGSDYAPGSYGINIFDNKYHLYVETGNAGTKPSVLYTEPAMPALEFHNYLHTSVIPKDSFYITGFPYANDRYLYGTVRANRGKIKIAGDIPEPALYMARYFTNYLYINEGIHVEKAPTSYRMLSQSGQWVNTERKNIITTYSPSLKEIIKATNFVSHNLYADALLKTLGIRYKTGTNENISSFEKGTKVIKNHLENKGIQTASLWMYDGSGLAVTNKVTADFLCNLYAYIHNSDVSDAFNYSLPRTGIDGTVRNLLKGTKLHGKARLKSGSMSRVCGYGGYIEKDGKTYAVALIINNYSCKNSQLRSSTEKLLLSLF